MRKFLCDSREAHVIRSRQGPICSQIDHAKTLRGPPPQGVINHLETGTGSVKAGAVSEAEPSIRRPLSVNKTNSEQTTRMFWRERKVGGHSFRSDERGYGGVVASRSGNSNRTRKQNRSAFALVESGGRSQSTWPSSDGTMECS